MREAQREVGEMHPHRILLLTKGIQVLHSFDRAVRVSRDVVFDESTFWYEPDSAPSEPTEEELDVNSYDDVWPSPLPKEGSSSTKLSGP